MLSDIVLGLMSGSSLDGIDLVMVEFLTGDDDVIEWKLLATHEEPLESYWRKRLESAPKLNALELHRLDASLGGLFGEMCSRFITATGIRPDYIASHGHTVFHAPKQGFSVQIGSAAHLAAFTGVPVITDFRSNDMAHGGQGAPLAPIVEKYLFAGYGFYLNLGGIANLSSHDGDDIKAWDICPCNQLLNYLAAKRRMRYDNKGALSQQGIISDDLLAKLKGVIPFPLDKPFSLDNSFITNSFLPILDASELSIEDQLRTIVDYISESIAIQVQHSIQKSASNDGHLIPTLLVTGGGAHNTFLVDEIHNKLKQFNVELRIPENDIIDFKEAILMALCGLLRTIEAANALASVTGADGDTINGAVYFP